MNAEHVLLTHFSARYPKMPPDGLGKLRQNGNGKQGILGLAFDHLDLKIGEMWKMNKYLGAVEQSFKDTEEDEGEDVDVVNVDVS